jgi:exopolysaccharide biosynthesis polyprenyl glycosylphosphotransferase
MMQPDSGQQISKSGIGIQAWSEGPPADMLANKDRSLQVGIIEYTDGAIGSYTSSELIQEPVSPFQAGMQRRRRPSSTIRRLLLLLGDSLILVAALLFVLVPQQQLDLTLKDFLRVAFIFLAVAVPGHVLWRLALGWIMQMPRFRPRAVIIGINPAGAAMVAELRKAKRPVIDVLGYVSEGSSEQTSRHETLPVLGGSKALHLLARSDSVDMIIMAIDYRDNPTLFQEVLEAAQLGIAVLPMARAYEDTCGKIPVEHIGDQWFNTLPVAPVVQPLYACWRKMLDFAFGLIGLAALLLLWPVIAAAIYIDSPGPIFYKQERLGLRGQAFQVLKFRSMRIDAEKRGQAVWAKQNDSRTTRVGRFLRATHLDELPQVINILRGEMTLIGPRPERGSFVNELEKTIPFYRCRLSVKPGLTGWAQVKYSYTNSNQEALVKLQYDLYYIKHQSVMLDLFILLKTVVEVLLCHGR